MRILTIHAESVFELPTLVAYDVLRQTRRSYVVRRGQMTIAIPKNSKDVFTDPSTAIAEYDRRLSGTIEAFRRAQDEIAECIRARRALHNARGSIEVWVHNIDGVGSRAMLSAGGVWIENANIS